MLPFNLSQADADSVNIERKMHSSIMIRDRMYVLHLLHLGFSRKDCAEIVGCHRNSVTHYIKLYRAGGLEAIRQTNYSDSRHELHPLYKEVDRALEEANCSTLSDVAELLRTKFNYQRSHEAVRQLLHRLGYKRRKNGTFPGKNDDFDKWQAKQEAFIEKLYKLIQKADNETIDLVFSDAAHFVYGKFSNFSWGKKVQYTPSGHGRYRVNVYGAYDVITNQVYSMYNEGYVDANFIVEYLNWLRKDIYQDQNWPLHIVLDNARYQHCNYVKQTAEQLNIVLEFLPGYSPNLNLIERLWKYMKQLLGKEYHDGKTTFYQAIVSLLHSLGDHDHQASLKTLLNPLFQRFEKAQILGC